MPKPILIDMFEDEDEEEPVLLDDYEGSSTYADFRSDYHLADYDIGVTARPQEPKR